MSNPKNAMYAQSGGVTAVINSSACGVIETARKHSSKIGTVYAARNGIIGALTEDIIDTQHESSEDIANLKQTPAGAFGSCRYKLKSFAENKEEYQRLIEVFKAYEIGFFFYNGGGDSQDTANKISQISNDLGYPVQCIGIPKTIDNDLPFTDVCPGFGSVAKYTAVSTLEATMDVESMSASSTKVFILEVMGRHAGFIAAAGGLAQNKDNPAPQIILFPEITFDESKFCNKVQESVDKHGYCVVVASEGIKNSSGEFLSAAGLTDAFGHSQLGGVAPVLASIVKNKLGFKYHWAVADYLQRSARHLAAKSDVEQAYALGKAAVDFALAGKNGVMPIIVRNSSTPYSWTIGEIELHKVANIEKKMPVEFITADGFGITPACRDYLQPLICGEDYPQYKNGLPTYVRLKKHLVKKRLPKFSV